MKENGQKSDRKCRKEKKEEKLLSAVFAAEAAVMAAEIFRETHTFRTVRYPVFSEKWKGTRTREKCRMVFLSDLHNQVYGKENSRLFHAVKREHPDVILIGGDMLVGKNGSDYRPAAEFVKRLPSLCPVCYANGNHEQRMKEQPEVYGQSYKAYKEELVQAGVHFLENASCEFLCKGVTIRVTGLELPGSVYRKGRRKKLDVGVIRKCAGDCTGTAYQILLAHNPSYMEQYLTWGADLALSGHFHGGVVRIPGLGGIISPGFQLFPEYSGGCRRIGDQTAVVSRGLGCHTIPLRLFNPAEIVTLIF